MEKQNDIADLSMLDLFRIEAENYTKILESGLVEIEQNQIPQKIEPLMRAAHSIKGAARIVGLDTVVEIAHAMEDVLCAAQQNSLKLVSRNIDMLLKGNDVFINLTKIDIGAIPEWLQEHSETIKALGKRIRESITEQESSTSETKKSGAEEDIEINVQKEILPGTSVNNMPALDVPDYPVNQGVTLKESPEEKEESFVRVASESLNRLMGFAGECLVQARSTKPFSNSLLKMKDRQIELISVLEEIFEFSKNNSVPKEVLERFHESLKQLDLIRDLVVTQIVDFELFSRNLEHLADRLYGEVVAIRMRPFSDGLAGFPRMVRDLAKNMGKKIKFRILGESTKVDRDILEKLEAPLTHLLRNAIDHGLETPEERVAVNKPDEGTLILEARHSSGALNIRLAEDGRGIDLEKIRRKIVEKGYTSQEMAANLNEGELLDFLFLPGFSTAKKVTEFSGRGVGLDVVLTMVQRVGGSVKVETKPGNGTSFHLHLPLTLSVLRVLLVEICGEPYAVPLSRIDRVLQLSHDKLKTVENKQFYTFENENIGILYAHQVLHMPPSDNRYPGLHIVFVSDRLNRYGLVVDRFLGERELVVIPLDARLGTIPDISAGAILEDGSPVLILDVDDVVRSIDNLLTHSSLHKVGGRKILADGTKKQILVVDDSLTVREVERRLLENSGYEVTVAVDGMDGWNILALNSFDLVISDIDMPRMNGIDLIKKIKSDLRLKKLPVIIVSYKDREEDRIKGLEAGADYYLTKSSFHDESLSNAVRDLIGEP